MILGGSEFRTRTLVTVSEARIVIGNCGETLKAISVVKLATLCMHDGQGIAMVAQR